MLPVTGFATVSQIAKSLSNIMLHHKVLLQLSLKNVTSQDYVININDMWKY